MAHPETSQTVSCQLDPARAAAMHILLGRDGALPGVGDTLPYFWHHLYFWQPAAQLGADGHMKTGGFIPDLGLPRRMWAGGKLRFQAPLRIGISAERVTTLEKIERKQGRSGPLGFVTLRHEYRQKGRLCVTERQDLVYRGDHTGKTSAKPIAATDEETRFQRQFEATQLFRYSALTFNGHRIHYDKTYAATEGYDGLVVHGPLLAQTLIGMAARALCGNLHSFSYRATSPLFEGETGVFCRRGEDYWVRGPDGRLCMEATAS